MGELIKCLDQESRKATGRWQVFLLCALAVAHALRGAALERQDECAEMALVEALHVAGSDVDANILVRNLSSMLQDRVFGDTEVGIRAIDGMDLENATMPEARLVAAWGVAWANWHKKDYEACLQQAKAALVLAEKLALPACESRNLESIAFALNSLERREEALESARRAVERAQVAQDATQEADALNFLSWLLFNLGRYQESLAEAEKAAERALEVEDFKTAASAFLWQSNCLNVLERSEESLAAARKAEKFAQTACDPGSENLAAFATVESLEKLRRYDEALAMAQTIATKAASRNDANTCRGPASARKRPGLSGSSIRRR